jgi:hypothetical protein
MLEQSDTQPNVITLWRMKAEDRLGNHPAFETNILLRGLGEPVSDAGSVFSASSTGSAVNLDVEWMAEVEWTSCVRLVGARSPAV